MKKTASESYPLSTFKGCGDAQTGSGNISLLHGQSSWRTLSCLHCVFFLTGKKWEPWKSNPVWLNSPWIKSQQEMTQSRQLTSGLGLN